MSQRETHRNFGTIFVQQYLSEAQMYKFKNGFAENDVEHHRIFELREPYTGRVYYDVKSDYVDRYVVWLVDEQRLALSTSRVQPDNEEWVFYDYNDLVEKLLLYEKSRECLELAEAYEEKMRKSREKNPPTPLLPCSEF